MVFIKSKPRRKFFRKKGRKLTKTQRKQVKQIISSVQEHKIFDTVNATTVSYAGSVIPLSDIPIGTSDLGRIGDQIVPTSLEMRFNWFAADSTNFCRAILFRWMPSFGTDPPAPGDILELVSSTNAVNSPIRQDTRNYFNVLMDKTWSLVLSGDTVIKDFRRTMKMAKRKIQYISNSTTDQTGGIYMLFITDSSLTAHPAINYYFRLRFTDS